MKWASLLRNTHQCQGYFSQSAQRGKKWRNSKNYSKYSVILGSFFKKNITNVFKKSPKM